MKYNQIIYNYDINLSFKTKDPALLQPFNEC